MAGKRRGQKEVIPMKTWIIEHKFAWRPVLIRNKIAGIFMPQYWTWLRRYTRVSKFSHALDRYRTYDTVLGHHDYPIPGGEQ